MQRSSSTSTSVDLDAMQRRMAELEAEWGSLHVRLSRAGADAGNASAGHAHAIQASQAELATSEAANTALRDANAALEASQAALHASEARLQIVVESATEYAFVTADLGGTITGWNSGAERILGWSEAEVVGQNIEMFFTPEDRAARVPAEEMRTALDQGRAADERWHLRHDGGRFWASGTMMPMRGLGGEAMGYLKILRDRTQQHEAGQALHRSEARLRESEARFRALADNMPQLAWMADADGSIVWYNRRWHEYSGTTPEQMQGWGWQAVHDPRMLPDVLERWQASIATGAPFEMTFPLRGADGVFRPFLTRVQPVRDAPNAEYPEGQVTRWFGTNTDVTESRAAEAANAHLAAIVASTEDAIVSFALECGRVLTWNKGAERLFGYTEAEMVGRPATRLLPSDLPEDERAGLLAWAMAGRAVMAYETERVTKGGERIPVSITATRMKTPSGRIVGVSSIFHDLRPRVRAEAALRESEARFRATFEQAAVGIAHVGLDGRWLRVNGRLCAMLGYSEAELLERTFQEVTHPDDVEPNLAHIRRLLGGEVATYSMEKRYLRQDGGILWAVLTASLLRDHAGTPRHFISVMEDITPRKQAEERLRESEAQLRQAQKLEAIGRLAAGVAHDFNNLLQGVSGGIELVLDEVEAGTPAHEFAELALGSARRGSTLTHQLLSYARKQMLQPKLIELAPFLSDMQRLLARTLGPHIAIKARAHGTPRIHVDLGQLETAVLNLAINAAHAMSRGGTLLLDASVDSADQERVVIAMTDTGAGMDAATLAQAFDPFFTTKGLDGTGLGLSMVQGFVMQSGGEVRIESAPGQGTTVMLWLPAAQSASSSHEQQSAPARLRGSGRLLLVDDVSDVLVTAGAFLERAGFQVVQAGGGEQALAVLAAGECFDALVTDYAMPGMNGVDLIEQARAVQPGLPALLITGFAEVGGAETLPEAVAVLRKPFQRWQLVEAVLQAVRQDTAQAGISDEGQQGRG